MAIAKGSAAYKKKDGTLTISQDQRTIIWTPVTPRGASPGVTIAIAEITSMCGRTCD
jgi:transcription initiation factor TFIIH subunit 1